MSVRALSPTQFAGKINLPDGRYVYSDQDSMADDLYAAHSMHEESLDNYKFKPVSKR